MAVKIKLSDIRAVKVDNVIIIANYQQERLNRVLIKIFRKFRSLAPISTVSFQPSDNPA